MILNLGSLAFNAQLHDGGGTPAWGTELGQGEGYKFSFEDKDNFLASMVYNAIPDANDIFCPLGKGGAQANDYEFVIGSIFNKIYVNGIFVDNACFLLLIVKKIIGNHHIGRRTLKYNPRMKYHDSEVNNDCYQKMTHTLGLTGNAAWFIHEINVKNQDELHFTAYILSDNAISYASNDERKFAMREQIKNANAIHRNHPTYLQRIYCGSPGTGKSYLVKNNVLENVKEEFIFRTTFHPDSDYASFVGTYKPVIKEDAISYGFEPQVFTEAYIKAWQYPNEQIYLVIEEINRGNCAQIFGDLFQLLDRKNGVSEYPVKADAALAKYLIEELRDGASEGIEKGKLKLPANLNIIATMNTSDQSLFPMDSAFKRRWEWKYIPTIAPTDKERKLDLNFKESKEGGDKQTIDAGNYSYSWKRFLNAINIRITKATHSDDKQLGFWFVKAENEEDNISVSTFVSKVIFYLWNDIFKDFGPKDTNPFTVEINGRKEIMPFSSFFEINSDGQIVENIGVLHTFMQNLKIEPEIKKEIIEVQDIQEQGDNPDE